MVKPIYLYGHNILTRPSIDFSFEDETDSFTANLEFYIKDLFDTMYNADGAGLAGTQIGIYKRLFVVDAEISEGVHFKGVFINPHILSYFGDFYSMEEGCLSLPGIHARVIRPGKIEMEYFDENYVKQKKIFAGLESRVIQHEYDHLEGRLFIDRLDLDTKGKLLLPLLNIKQRKIETKYSII